MYMNVFCTIISSGAREAEGRPSEANLKIFFVIKVFSGNFDNRKICTILREISYVKMEKYMYTVVTVTTVYIQ